MSAITTQPSYKPVNTGDLRSAANDLDAQGNACLSNYARLLRAAAVELGDRRDGQPQIIILSPQAPEQMLDSADVPVVGEIQPHADAVYGHLFTLPEEAIRFIGA